MAIGYYADSAFSGYEIIDFVYSINDYVLWKYTSCDTEYPVHKSKVCYKGNGESYFRANGRKLYLNDFIRY